MPTIYESAHPKEKHIGVKGHKHPIDKTPMRPFSAYAVLPEGVRFETQEAEETVEIFLRQHPIVNVPWILLAGVLLFAPTVVFPIIFVNITLPFVLPFGYILIGSIVWYLCTVGFILTNFLHWFFNIYIVTNERIVDIDFLYLLYKHFSQAELTKIQDISFTSSGLLQTIFNFGTVYIQTAAEVPTIQFELIPYPQKVVEKIRSLAEQVQEGNV